MQVYVTSVQLFYNLRIWMLTRYLPRQCFRLTCVNSYKR